MKKGMILLFMLMMSCIVFAQNVKYTYDNAGNRVKREIVMDTKALQQEEGAMEHYSDILSERTIRIYPNPTSGRLKIEIGGV